MERRKEEKTPARETEEKKREKEREEEEELRGTLNSRKEKRIKIYMPVEAIVDILDGARIVIVTPLAKDRTRIENTISQEKEGSVVVRRVIETINMFKAKEIDEESIVVISNYGVIVEMGLLNDLLEEIGERRIIVSMEGEKEEEMLKEYRMVHKTQTKREFYIEGRTHLARLGVLFSVTKARPIKNLCVIVSHPKEERRVQVFLNAFGVATEINPKKKREGVVAIFNPKYGVNKKLLEQYSLIVDNTGESDTEMLEDVKVGILKIVTEGPPSREDPRFKKLFETGMKYKYRIESVIKLITRNVLNGKDEIDERVVKNLKGPLRIL